MPAFSVNLSWGEFPDSFNFKVGGLRVKKIVSRDNTGGTVSRTFNYNLFFSSPYSSGILAGYPVHLIKRYDLGGNFLGIDQIVSNSPLPLTTDGQTVRYEFVTQYQDSTATSLKTEYSYSSDFANFSFGDNTGAPPTLHSWKNNILTRKSAYEKTGTDYRILSDEWNFYTSHKSFEDLFGMIANHLKKYYIASEWYLLDSTASIDYSYPATTTKTLQTGVKYLYNDSFLVSRTRTKNSLGKLMESKTWYPFDYNDISGYNMATLVGAHDMSVPVKQETSVNGKIKSGTITKYNAMAQPVELFNYEGAVLSDTVVHNRNTMLESGYVSQGTLIYQSDNPLQITLKGNSITSYVWDYSGNYPIAKVMGGAQSAIAYTSFEADGKGNWTFSGSPVTTSGSVTGNKAYLLSAGSVSRTGLTSSVKYIVSYWLKSAGTATITGGTQTNSITGRTAGNFTYHEVNITGTTTLTLTGSGYIDELRLYPLGAQMATYTYEPLIGMSSQCDANNRITYYEYDDLGRLDLVRDQDGHIVKRICYNYAGQPESNCVIPGAYATWEFKNVHSTISDGYYNQTGDLYLELRNSNGDPLTTHDPLTIYFNAVQQYIDVDGTTVLATQSNPVSSIIPDGTSDFLYVSNMSIKHYPVDANGNQTDYSYQAHAEITPGTGYIILNP
jgi:YD repeat-containing protein